MRVWGIEPIRLGLCLRWVCVPTHSLEVANEVDKVHFAPWYRNAMKLHFADDLKPILEAETDLETPARWEPKEEVEKEYLNRAFGNAYDFNQSPGA